MAQRDRIDTDILKENVTISSVIERYVTWDKKKTNARNGDYWACCPFHGEKSPSFHCEDKKGRYYCFGCGEKGDHFSFLMNYAGLDFKAAVETLGGDLSAQSNLDPTRKAELDLKHAEQRNKRAREEERSEAWREKSVREIWSGSRPMVIGDLAHRYLVGRCPALESADLVPTLRFHPMLAYDKAQSFPALVAGVQNEFNKLTAVWRIFLDNDGGKAPVKDPKRGYGKAAGGAVRLGPITKNIITCEGIETGQGIRVLTDFKRTVFCCLSTSGLAGFNPPNGVHHVDKYLDGDEPRFDPNGDGIRTPPGQAAGDRFDARAAELGVSTSRNTPPSGSDWLDVANSYYRSNQE